MNQKLMLMIFTTQNIDSNELWKKYSADETFMKISGNISLYLEAYLVLCLRSFEGSTMLDVKSSRELKGKKNSAWTLRT